MIVAIALLAAFVLFFMGFLIAPLIVVAIGYGLFSGAARGGRS